MSYLLNLPVHPRTGLKALGVTRTGQPVWPIAGGSGDGGDGADGGSGGDGGGSGDGGGAGSGDGGDPGDGGTGDDGGSKGGTDKGFPDNTPVADMTAEQQAAYWKFHARKHEERANARADYDAVKAKADELDELKKSQMSDQDKAVQEAKDQARAETLAEVGGRMVDTHINAAVTANRITQDQADVVLGSLDRSKFLTDDGDVDADKVEALLTTLAPSSNGDEKGRKVDLGQGRREAQKVSAMERGREEARRRYGDADKK